MDSASRLRHDSRANPHSRPRHHSAASPTSTSTTPGSFSLPTTNRSKLSRLTEINGASLASLQIG